MTQVILTVRTQHRPKGTTNLANGDEYILRRWACRLEEGRSGFSLPKQLPYVKKVEFGLHDTFKDPHRVVTRAPFSVIEEGWGEFDLDIIVHFHHSSETFRITHDLNFGEGETYNKQYRFNMPNASPEFLALFNQRPGAARKTVPPSDTKARKAPPREAGRSKLHSSPHSNDYSDSLSSYSDNSDSDDSSERRSNQSGRSKAQSISSGASGSSRKRARVTAVGRADDARSTISTKQIPRANGAAAGLSKAAARQDGRPTVSYKQRPAADASASAAATGRAALKEHPRLTPSPPLPPSRGADIRHQRNQSNGIRPVARNDREPLPSIRRTSNASSGGDAGGVTRQRRSPSDASSKARTGASSFASAKMQQLQSQSERRLSAVGRGSTAVERPAAPANRADRTPTAGVAGVMRRLGDALAIPGAKAQPRHQTLAPAETRKASVSPTLGPDVYADSTMPYENMSMAAGIAMVKVPKKRDRMVKADKDLDQPQSKVARIDPEPPHSPKRPNGDMPSITSVNREMKRVLEKAREKSSQLTVAKTDARHHVPSASSNIGIGGLVRNARSDRVGRNGVNNGATSTEVTVKDEYPDAVFASGDEHSDPALDSGTSRKKLKRDDSSVSSASATKQTKPVAPRASAGAGTSAARSPPGHNRPREHQPPKTSLMRTMKRPGSAEKRNGVKPGMSAAPVASKPPTYTEPAKASQPSNLVRQMKRIMEIAQSMKERDLVAFLKLLHTLRIEQDPEEADTMTKSAADKVKETGEYSCNLSALHPAAIGKLWDFVSEIAV
ncbi:transcription factor TFIIF complex subunit Tfg3 [Coemansia erecta]|uniref:Transcription factor TFIIF complex subunit Tfg3 n=1 Tax=Coemansia erecta TaxID=147472 RepID=A0A9W7XWW6_9FUNG|nr:transcription factor TFIIF complex subunit Tfg3 [Coemansia erecta]